MYKTLNQRAGSLKFEMYQILLEKVNILLVKK